jgi:hypothetical protein
MTSELPLLKEELDELEAGFELEREFEEGTGKKSNPEVVMRDINDHKSLDTGLLEFKVLISHRMTIIMYPLGIGNSAYVAGTRDS